MASTIPPIPRYQISPCREKVPDTLGFPRLPPHQLADPAFYRNPDNVVLVTKRLAEIEAQHAQAFERWEHLESIAAAS
jgi:hypothetical protein